MVCVNVSPSYEPHGFAGGLVALSRAATVAPRGVVALLGAAWLDVVVLTHVDAFFLTYHRRCENARGILAIQELYHVSAQRGTQCR